MSSEIAIGHSEHQPITQRVEFLACASLRNAGKRGRTCRRERGHSNYDWSGKFRIARRHEINVELEQMKRSGAEQVNEKVGLARGRQGGAIQIGWQKSELLGLRKTDCRGSGPSQHGRTLVCTGLGAGKTGRGKHVVRGVIRIWPHTQLRVIIE